jgi:serine/threonine protein phosphatase PrpC
VVASVRGAQEASGASFEGRLEFCCESDVGRSREQNEDNHGLLSPQDSGAGWLFLVADGMGGAAGGKTASEMAVRLIREHYPAQAAQQPDDLFAALSASIEAANEAIWRRSREDRAYQGMGTTVTALVVRDNLAYTAHVGDSRIYRFRGGRLERLMRDHTRVQMLADQGIITPSEANHHPEGHVISRNLGGLPELEVDTPDDGPFPIREGDVFLLCSDGLHGLVEDEAIRQILAAAPPREAVPGLIRLANTMGGYDNITACVVCAGAGMPAWRDFDPDTFEALLDELALDVRNDTELFSSYDPSALNPRDFDTGHLRAISATPALPSTQEVKRVTAATPAEEPTLKRASLQHTVSLASPFLKPRNPDGAPDASPPPTTTPPLAPMGASPQPARAPDDAPAAPRRSPLAPLLLVAVVLVSLALLAALIGGAIFFFRDAPPPPPPSAPAE